MSDDFIPKASDVLTILDGDVQSQGIKISHREWLDMASEEWNKIPEQVKSAAYQAAKVRGWSDEAIKSIMTKQYPHITNHIMDFAIKLLNDLLEKYPVDIEQVYTKDLNIEIVHGSKDAPDLS